MSESATAENGGSGPLAGVRVVELAGLGPTPFCGMVLNDLGAEVIRVDRVKADAGVGPDPRFDLHNRGKRSICLDLKHVAAREVLLRLVAESDALIEGFRPGVMERLGIGPASCLARNRRLVFGRMTGWGQEGPLSPRAGHDIDYIAVSGVLGLIGGDDPVPPLNLVGDFGGGGMLLAVGVLAGLISAMSSGHGQVVDAAMVDGSALLTTATHGLLAAGQWTAGRKSNLLDGGAPFYSVYSTSDGGHMAVGALEPRFFAELLAVLGLTGAEVGEQADRAAWPQMRRRFADTFATRTRAEWEELFAGSDACVAPVLGPDEASVHYHNRARSTFVEAGGVTQPGPAPRFSRTTAREVGVPPEPGADTDDVLAELAYDDGNVKELRGIGAIA